jgi:FtsH-binding integral membrane protein
MNRPMLHRVLRFVWLGLVLWWAGFWAWFVVAVSIGESKPPPLWIPLAWLASLAGLVVLSWKRSTLGGIALITAGFGAALYFPDASARALLAAPAIALGFGGLALRYPRDSRT